MIGAGRLGECLAGTPVSEPNDITVVDADMTRPRDL